MVGIDRMFPVFLSSKCYRTALTRPAARLIDRGAAADAATDPVGALKSRLSPTVSWPPPSRRGVMAAWAALRARPRLSRMRASASSREIVGVMAGLLTSKDSWQSLDGVRERSNRVVWRTFSSRRGTVVVVVLVP